MNGKTNVPPGYKQTEVGIIPEDWALKKLGEIAKIVKGEQFSKKNMKEGEIYPVYNGGREYSGFTGKFNSASQTIIISEGGNSCGYVNFIKKNFWCGGHCYKLLITTTTNKLFLYYSLKNNESIIMNLRVGSGLPNIQKKEVENVIIPLPPTLSEQKAIAEVLSDFDLLIENLDKLIEKKKAIKQGAMQELLTGKKRLPRFTDKWVTKKLGEILKYEQPTKYIVKSTEYLDNGFIPVLTAGKTFILGYTDEVENIYKDVPVIIFDDFTTASKYVDFYFKVKSSAMKILQLKDSTCNLKFIFQKMQMINYSLNEGDHKRRWIAEYSKISIRIPPTLSEQKAIAEILSEMDAEINALEKKKQKYEALKKGAMELLLTGKIRLIKEKKEAQE